MRLYYSDEWVTLYHGDCRDALTLALQAHAVVTDPPYGVELAGKSTKWTARSGVGYSSFVDTPENVERLVVPVVENLSQTHRCVVTPGLRMMWCYPKPTAVGAIFYPSGAGPGPWGFICWQPIFYYGKCPYLAAGKGSRPDSFSTTEAAEPNGHPCPKPIKTMRWLVQKATLPGETVFDPFAGSGTTLRAAKDCGRRALGIEIEERYCEVAAKRLAQEVLDLEAA